MKKIFALAAMTAITMTAASVYAGDNHNNTPEYAEVITQSNLNFSAELVDGHVMMKWDAIAMPNGEAFKWYKVMKGAADLVYPDQPAIHVGTKQNETTAKDWNPGSSQHYKVCVVTMKPNRQKGRYCSQAVHITTDGSTAKTSTKTSNYTSTDTKTTTNTTYATLSQKTKDKLEKVVDNFLLTIDEKYGDDMAMKKAVIETVVEKIEELKMKKPSMKAILDYLITLLNEALTLSDIESIFDL